MSPERKEGPKLSDILGHGLLTQCQPGPGPWAYEGGRGGDPSDWEMVVGTWDSSPCGRNGGQWWCSLTPFPSYFCWDGSWILVSRRTDVSKEAPGSGSGLETGIRSL